MYPLINNKDITSSIRNDTSTDPASHFLSKSRLSIGSNVVPSCQRFVKIDLLADWILLIYDIICPKKQQQTQNIPSTYEIINTTWTVAISFCLTSQETVQMVEWLSLCIVFTNSVLIMSPLFVVLEMWLFFRGRGRLMLVTVVIIYYVLHYKLLSWITQLRNSISSNQPTMCILKFILVYIIIYYLL